MTGSDTDEANHATPASMTKRSGEVVVYAYAGCSTCKKALKWLADHDVAARVIPIVESPPSQRLSVEVEARAGEGVARFELPAARIKVDDQRLDVQTPPTYSVKPVLRGRCGRCRVRNGWHVVGKNEPIDVLAGVAEMALDHTVARKLAADLIDLVTIHAETNGDLVVVKSGVPGGEQVDDLLTTTHSVDCSALSTSLARVPRPSPSDASLRVLGETAGAPDRRMRRKIR